MKLTRAVAQRIFSPGSRHLMVRSEESGLYHIVGPKLWGRAMPDETRCGLDRGRGLRWIDPAAGRSELCDACWAAFGAPDQEVQR